MHSMLGIAPARGKCYKKHSMHFAPQNKEENPLLLQRQSHFAPQNKEDYHERIHSKSSRWKKFNTGRSKKSNGDHVKRRGNAGTDRSIFNGNAHERRNVRGTHRSGIGAAR